MTWQRSYQTGSLHMSWNRTREHITWAILQALGITSDQSSGKQSMTSKGQDHSLSFYQMTLLNENRNCQERQNVYLETPKRSLWIYNVQWKSINVAQNIISLLRQETVTEIRGRTRDYWDNKFITRGQRWPCIPHLITTQIQIFKKVAILDFQSDWF